MRHWIGWLVLALVLSWMVPSTYVRAESGRRMNVGSGPSYLILRTPARSEKHRTYYPARGYGAMASPYTYGWFGAQSKRHWSRNTGYFGDYLQWSVR